MRITLTNNFHGTTCNVVVRGAEGDVEYELSDSQANRVKRTLCGIDACACGGVRCDEWDLRDDRPYARPVLVNKAREREYAFGC